MTEYFDSVRKRDGRVVPFNESKIADAIFKAAEAVGGKDRKAAERLAKEVTKTLREKFGQKTPSIEEIQDVVEKTLIEFGHAKTAKAYILYREKRAQARRELQVRRKVIDSGDTTDVLLLVTGTDKTQYHTWDKGKIAEALMKEAGLKQETAYEVASNVEKKILKSGATQISTSLIRALVDNELFELGETKKLEKQTSIGIPIHDLKQIITLMSSENANTVANNPEAVNLAIAEKILKQYALKEIFSEDVADAHLKGAIHLHDLGYPTRTYCSNHSLEYLKKYGLELHNLSTTSSPAKHAGTLTGHLNTFLASMQAYYAGALGIGFVNIFYAPLIVGLTPEQLKQEAQYLIFSCSQNAFSRGSQTLFIDSNINFGVPNYLKEVPAIGPNGKYMWRHENGEIERLDEAPRDENHNVIQPKEGRILTYADFEKEAQAFAKALMDVWREGDSRGQVFPFPKGNYHINEETFTDPKQKELFDYACLIASENGSPYFVFDRDEVTLSMCFTADTKVLMRKNGEPVYDEISRIYDSIEGVEEKGFEFWKYPVERIELPNYEADKLTFTTVKGILKQKYKGKVFEIILGTDAKVSVSPNHEFFILKNNELKRIRVENLKRNDLLPIFKGIEWQKVDRTLGHNLIQANGNAVSCLYQKHPKNASIKQAINGLHFSAIKDIKEKDYDGFVYDFEVADEEHGFILPNGLYVSNCCRLRHKVTDKYMIKHPESMRFCGFQNVTINLPHAAYKAGKSNVEQCIKEIQQAMDLAMKAHLQKKDFVAKLMSQPGMPLWQVGQKAKDGLPYIDLKKATYIIGLVGLNECVKYLMDKELHESDQAYKLGLKIISAMYLKVKEFEKKHGLKVTLEETPAESASFRLARVDLKEFPEAKDYVRGDLEKKEVYYTNSIHLAPDAPNDIIERIEKQGKFNTLIESGAITHVFLGEQRPSPEAIAKLVQRTWEKTQSAQITISPEFTICNDCNRISPGYKRLSEKEKVEVKA